MKNILLLIISILIVGCTNSSFKDDGSNMYSKGKQYPAIYDDGTNKTNPNLLKSKNNDTALKNNIKSRNPIDKNNIKPKKTVKIIKNNKINYVKKNISPSKPKVSNIKKIRKKQLTLNNMNFLYPIEPKNLFSVSEAENSTLNLSIKSNSPIFPIAPGIVIFSGTRNSLGNTIFIYHDSGYVSIYYNLKKLKVTKGDYIKKNTAIIAYADKNFHFELRKQTKKGVIKIDPKKFLKKRRK
ncbi:M23 family metallopeptidase [Haliovirga abyssi]|uniref:M23ase beta-sheet core domain-containing protein n=1 Tax=Haliovirga abyssi TaxID=2996794 RepID=A0AAU9DSK4_9FUSO|nr:M23 family metallopeptidase [Haliovirga abyssi]BDU50019.1 hypothetical protein HLVA_05880 [Haliovirga abyssi]